MITGLVGFAMLAIGWDALAQAAPRTANVPAPALNAASDATEPNARIRQLESLVSQYQQRESQYQAQLEQANQQLARYEDILNALQQRGLIRLTQDGQILLGRRNAFQEEGGD